MKQAELVDSVESLVDGSTLQAVVRALAAVAYAKEEHLQANWQDHDTARVWRLAARALDRAADRIEV